MEILFYAILVACISCGNVACFMLGARVGIRVRAEPTPETIGVPNGGSFKKKERPKKMAHETDAERAARKEEERMEVILQNIDNYDGTGVGQKEVP